MLVKSLTLFVAIAALLVLVFATRGDSTRANVGTQVTAETAIRISGSSSSDAGAGGMLLDSIPRVQSWEALTASITSRTNVIIIDSSAVSDAPATFLEQQVEQGISLVGINVPLAELRRISNFDEAVRENAIDPVKGPKLADPAPAPSEPFYSYVRMNPSDSEVRRVSQGQKKMSSGLLGADLERTASSRLSSTEPP